MTHSLLVPLGHHTVLIAEDTPENRTQWIKKKKIEIPLRDFTSDTDSKEVVQAAKEIFRLDGVSLHSNLLTAEGDEIDATQAAEFLPGLCRPKQRIKILVKSYLITSSRSNKTGIEVPGKFTVFNVLTEANKLISDNASVVEEIISEGLASQGDVLTIASLLVAGGYASSSVLGSSSVYFGGGYTATGIQFDSGSIQATHNRSSLKKMQEETLLLEDGTSGKLRFGQRYPVETSKTTTLGSTTGTTTPTIQYEDLGVTLQVGAQVAGPTAVNLRVHQTIRSLNGTTLNGIPEIDNQEISTSLSVPGNGSALLLSNLSQTQAKAIRGFASFFPTESALDSSTSELLLIVTPILLDSSVKR